MWWDTGGYFYSGSFGRPRSTNGQPTSITLSTNFIFKGRKRREMENKPASVNLAKAKLLVHYQDYYSLWPASQLVSTGRWETKLIWRSRYKISTRSFLHSRRGFLFSFSLALDLALFICGQKNWERWDLKPSYYHFNSSETFFVSFCNRECEINILFYFLQLHGLCHFVKIDVLKVKRTKKGWHLFPQLGRSDGRRSHPSVSMRAKSG